MFLKLFLQKLNNIFFQRAYLLLLCLFLLDSCSNDGCIEADDFGEYESQLLEVPANATQESCTFNHAKALTDPDQGAGIKVCLTSGNNTVTDEQGNSSSSSTGCNGFSDADIRTICISNCVQLCNTNSSNNSGSAEPNWISTDEKVSGMNSGVTIKPGAQIKIRATGSVVLGSSVEYPDIFVQAVNPRPHSYNNLWADNFFDVRRNQGLFVKFSGSWTDYGDNSDPDNQVGGGAIALGGSQDDKIINGAKRLVAYIIPHQVGYDFDTSAATEKAGSIEVPLLPDPDVWTCTYTGAELLESECNNIAGGYVANGYNRVSDSFTNTVFPLTSNFRSTILGRNGGMIRWDNDGLVSDAEDPFTGVVCNGITGSCQNTSNLGYRGVIVGNLSGSSVEIQNNRQKAVKVSLKSLVADSGCNITISNLSIKTSSGTQIRAISNVSVSNTNWISENITLEPSQKLEIAQNNSNYPSGINCGLVMGAKISEYHDITIETSGFVKLTMLRGSGSCNIKGRIVNPNGSQFDVDSAYTADFYEYDRFDSSTSNDPINTLNVPASPTTGSTVWSNSFFVRKGQAIRFSPESWNGNWTTSTGLQRKCGIGMAMFISPRPALLCRGKADDVVNNPVCIPEFESGALIGCQAVSSNCSNPSSGAYCSGSCLRTISCTNGTESNNFAKTGCTISAASASCTYNSQITASSCTTCANEMLAAALVEAKLPISNIDQCYDLENYRGKVENIPSSNSLTKSAVDTFLGDSAKAKGLVKLGLFSNKYGNFDNFSDTGDTDQQANVNNKIYELKSPIIFTESGRLKFMTLDGRDFRSMEQSYNNNSTPGANYSGSNGFKIKTRGTLEFNNGTWLQARLCAETSDSSAICKNINPTSIADQPSIINITAPTQLSAVSLAPTITSSYKFNDYGTLVRVGSNIQTGDCTTAANGIESYAGAPFYCHTKYYNTPTQIAAMSESQASTLNSNIRNLRVTFKILDPEQGNCSLVDQGTTNDGVKIDNPFYDNSTSGTCHTATVSSGNVVLSQVPGDGTTSNPGTCRKEFSCVNRYHNNSGKYLVNVQVKNPSGNNISNIIEGVINPIVRIMDGERDNPATSANEYSMGQAERVYRLLISDPRYKAILTIALVTMFTFYGFGYLIGVVEMNHGDIIGRIIKIGLVYLFVGEAGWEWFNKIVVKFFKDSTDYLAFMMASSFDNSPELLNAVRSGNYYDKSVLFGSIDRVFGLFFSDAVRWKISALLFASIFGWAYLFIIYSSFMLYVFAVANAVLLYLTAQVFISILFVLGPIFFVFTLFSQTKEMFDNWLKQLIGFSLQQIFLLTTLAFFNMLMYEVIKMALGYRICWDEVWTINIITRVTLLSWWTIAALPPRTNAHSEVGNIGNPDGIPSLFTILFIWVIASLMNKFISFMTNLASSISGGLSASSLGKGVSDFAASARKGASKWAGKLADKTGFTPIRTLDKFLFDSGKLAEEARAKKRKQNSMDFNNKNSMAKAGDKAVSQYKKDNALELSGMSKEEQRSKLNSVRDSAMTSQGKKLGLDDSKIKSLKSDTGLKYVGSNVFGAAFQAAKQAAFKGGSLGTSMNNRKLNEKFSHSEGQKALKNMTKDEREKFVESAKQGKIEVGNRFRHRVQDGLASTAEVIKNPITSLKNLAGKITKQTNYDKAAQQLKKEGVIKDHGSFGVFRDKNEKKLISERAKQIKESSKVEKTSDYKAIRQLEREQTFLNKKDEIRDSSSGAISSMKENLQNNLDRFRGKGASSTKEDVGERAKSNLESQQTKTQSSIGELREARKDAMSNVNEAREKLKGVEGYDKMQELEAKVNDNTASRGERSQYTRLKREIDSSEEGVEYKKAQIVAHQIDSQIEVAQKKSEDIDKKL